MGWTNENLLTCVLLLLLRSFFFLFLLLPLLLLLLLFLQVFKSVNATSYGLTNSAVYFSADFDVLWAKNSSNFESSAHRRLSWLVLRDLIKKVCGLDLSLCPQKKKNMPDQIFRYWKITTTTCCCCCCCSTKEAKKQLNWMGLFDFCWELGLSWLDETRPSKMLKTTFVNVNQADPNAPFFKYLYECQVGNTEIVNTISSSWMDSFSGQASSFFS